MCGRFALHTPLASILEQFGAASDGPLEPRYNVAPTQPVAVVRVRSGARRLERLRWGLVPPGSPGPSGGGPLLINARAETAHRKPAFREAFARRRCLVPADGFYEWERQGRTRSPLYFTATDGRPLALAGLWERWERAGQTALESCVVLTAAASGVVAPYHDRVPVLLAPDAYDRWLDPTPRSLDDLAPLLRPPPANALRVRALEPWVNDVRHEGPRCLTERLTLFEP